MQITDIKVRKLMQEGRLRAVVSVTIGDELAIHDIKVIEGPTRLFRGDAFPTGGGRRLPGHCPPDYPGGPPAAGGCDPCRLPPGKGRGAEQMQRLPYGDYFAEHFAASPASAPAAAVTPPLGNTGG